MVSTSQIITTVVVLSVVVASSFLLFHLSLIPIPTPTAGREKEVSPLPPPVPMTATDVLNVARGIYRQLPDVNHAACKTPILLGGTSSRLGYGSVREEGQWRICKVASLTNCKALTFGINTDWTFEEALVREFNCEVWANDPTIQGIQTIYPKQLHFDRLGIAGDESRPNYHRLEWFFERNRLDVVDILKVDVEDWEWPMLEDVVLRTTFLKDHVRQFTVELHYFRNGIQAACNLSDYDCQHGYLAKLQRILDSLREQGFVPLDYHLNPMSTVFMLSNTERFLCCHEVSYMNTALL